MMSVGFTVSLAKYMNNSTSHTTTILLLLSCSADTYLYLFLGGIIEFISYILLWPLVVYLGRVKSFVILNFFCGTAILVLALFIYFYPEGEHNNQVETFSFLLVYQFRIKHDIQE